MEKRATVFATQIPNRFDRETNTYVPSVNISPAAEHGDIVTLMPPQASFHATADLVKQMTEKLKGYDYDAGDSILALGDPTVMGVAFAILGKLKGKFRVLKWDRNIKRYTISSVIV